MAEWFRQASYGVRFDWGLAGAERISSATGCLVVVDVLSFTTSVTVAVEAGTRVFPYAWRDDTAATFAASRRAALAVGRRSVTATTPWSLSPAALRRAPFTPRLVLPSPNGSTIVAACRTHTVVAGSLRNAGAVGSWLARHGFGTPQRPLAVIAAGERWPDDSVRPGLEDFLGAGAIIAARCDAGPATLSPEAAAAYRCFQATPDLPDAVAHCASGTELTAAGFSEDVAIAAELDLCPAVPVLTDEAFTATG